MRRSPVASWRTCRGSAPVDVETCADRRGFRHGAREGGDQVRLASTGPHRLRPVPEPRVRRFSTRSARTACSCCTGDNPAPARRRCSTRSPSRCSARSPVRVGEGETGCACDYAEPETVTEVVLEFTVQGPPAPAGPQARTTNAPKRKRATGTTVQRGARALADLGRPRHRAATPRTA